MTKIIETDELLEIKDRMSAGKRVVLGTIALVPLLAPYELLIRPGWHDFVNLAFLFAAVISAGALMVSGFFVMAAIAGLDQSLRFDKRQQTFTYSAAAPLIPLRQVSYSTASIRGFDIETHDWSDSGPTHTLRIEMQDGRAFSSGTFWSRTDAEGARERVAALLGASYQRPALE